MGRFEELELKRLETEFNEFCEKNASYNSNCSGVGSCEECNSKMYPLRTKYLKAFINVFYESLCDCDESYEYPKFCWVSSENAKEFIIGDFHKEKCSSGQPISTCECLLAKFFKFCYGKDVKETDIKKSLDIIYQVFNKPPNKKQKYACVEYFKSQINHFQSIKPVRSEY